jgi:putative FmdB family regulatory protein
MPMFEYRCTECGTAFEELVVNADDFVQCPKCHSEKAEKLLSVFAAGASSVSPEPSAACGRPGGCCGCSGLE